MDFMSNWIEHRRLAFNADGTKGQNLINAMARLGFRNVKGYTAPIEETETGKHIADAFVIEADGHKVLWNIICDKWNLKYVKGYYM